MKSLSIVFTRTFNRGPAGLVVADAPPIPQAVVLNVDRLECRIDVKPCSMACGDATPAPPGTMLFTWSTGMSAAIPTHLIRSIRVVE